MMNLLKPKALHRLFCNYRAVNWVKEGALPQVASQGRSLSCWSEAAVACVEGLNKTPCVTAVLRPLASIGIRNTWGTHWHRSSVLVPCPCRDATSSDFIYTGGIYSTPCVTKKRNHFVTVVGFDREEGVEFLWIRNSWNTDWGLGGYMKYRLNMELKEGCSSIASHALYPVKYGYDNLHHSLWHHSSVLLPCPCRYCAPHLHMVQR